MNGAKRILLMVLAAMVALAAFAVGWISAPVAGGVRAASQAEGPSPGQMAAVQLSNWLLLTSTYRVVYLPAVLRP
jgi:hypothetical protein